MKRNQRLAFEQNILRTIRSLESAPKRLLVACSGGVDSMVLLEVLFRLRKMLDLEVVVAHVHHGSGNARFRTKAWKIVKKAAQEKGLTFISNSADGKPIDKTKRSSEAELREWRWLWLRQWQKEFSTEAIVVAHHYQDLLETRLMRLVRGTGAIGLKGMCLFHSKEKILRPFLMVEKPRVLEYAKTQDVAFVDDPTNEKPDAFRNWTRRWLLQLDKRQPNGARNLARSLSELVEQLDLVQNERSQNETTTGLTDGGIDRQQFLGASKGLRKADLARYCHKIGIKNYTQGHIEELIKRLDAREKQFTFEMLHCVWSVTPERIKASRSTGRV